MLSQKDRDGLDLAFDEATLLGVEVDRDSRLTAITLAVLTLPEVGQPPSDTRLQVLLHGVTRVAASLRMGIWNDANAPVTEFSLAEVLAVVQSFGGCVIYGGEFFDVHEAELGKWNNRFSLDERLSDEEAHDSICLFQEGGRDRHLDICIWFRDLALKSPTGRPLTIDEVVDGAERWWKAFRENDPRTQDRGLIPLK